MKSCPLCTEQLEAVVEDREVRIGTRSAQVMDRFLRCSGCGETFYLPGQMDATLRLASEAIRREEGLLTPAEIRAIRTRLGLSQHAFEQLLGVGPKTVVRWEKGLVFQNRATDSLLRVVAEFPEVVRFLARLHGVPLSDSAGITAG